jgi:hypothetical protein
MATGTATGLKSVEVFKDGVSLCRWDAGANPVPFPCVVVCPDGRFLFGKRLPERTDNRGEPIALPEIVADKVVVTHTSGTVDELICNNPPTPGR